MSEKRAPHLVVVGAGFGGLQLIHDLRNVDVRITLIDQRNHHLFQPLLYQVATTILATSEIAWPIRHLFKDRKEVTTLLGTVTDVDTEHRQVLLENGTEISYDMLVLATGARHAYFGNDQWEALAPGLKALEDATTIRRRLLLAFERAERESDEAKRQALLTFAIVGGGPTGVELAGIIAELAKQTIWPEFRNIDTRQTRVMLLEAGPRILAAFPEDLSSYALKALEKLGVEVRLGIPVKDITAEGVTVGEEFIPCRTAIWAAGVAASPAATWLNAESDRAGRVKVLSNLNVPGHEDIFVIGDTAWVEGPDGKPVPGIAPAAKQQGAYVAKVIKSRIEGKTPPMPFRYKHQGNLATIGRGAAVVDMGRFKLKGLIAWWFWGIAHIFFLIGTRSRAAVAWSWLWTYISGQHSARLITQGKPVER
ncbi:MULTISPECIES: NAD(P)/FAD-dependent oxidoreductase [Brucella/Ochrobactrum group]|jgi:NADH dehydrogenase|uniref:NADH:ubiquinone reductase (non-electrogenic) n=3 Tax=Brucella anthropi TaxID=529 RepID=A6X4N3_BRUA4|nr:MULTISPECIES: NAD(P)/FAD-dependent oxidoreductase [Brucella/Ochrobactrum group]MCR5942003.1 NAD(P)/FAD-dependent oxidoreductase [Ochrobactrum sp. XJ1]QTN05082.1 FAD-dependent oxidoreductase [Ochrobactrum sp. EEELCW01]ABS16187.1 FAD-dependent pyridine nucleotide-disulphide oxidoreductase [Brucella anthropi ATCC 49188]AIK42130.1 FAD dependent oxidoreductase family protein [Brucella anthropi]KAB2740218.1 NAD(P)/FAD-dependent oxidoreductase [Brucella anthropi]